MDNNLLESAITNSQHCQRNWNLEETIPEVDLNTLEHAVTQCASKQNRVFYKVHFIKDRNIIEKIYHQTDGFMINFETRETKKNPQTLANLLVAFTTQDEENEELRTTEEIDAGVQLEEKRLRDRWMAIGIAGGYLTLTANILGYSTGFCQCFDSGKIDSILGTDGTQLLVGVGFPGDLNKRTHHLEHDFTFRSFNKNISVEYI